MINHPINFDSKQVTHEKLLASNALMFGALAWRGYQLKRKGAVIVYGLKESEDFFQESINVEIGYISEEEAVRNYPDAVGLFQLLNEYDPQQEMVVIFTHSESNLVESYRLTLILPPLKCYILLQEQLLKNDVFNIQK
ncbi:MAG TPA: hypothetical protein DCP31_15945 [Cyanobacteria bacterium UBA8543]|nr:hypothetical protein [Cyanobacteria bacterium UBA8543]